MERKAKGKGYRKSGAPFMFGMGHKQHQRMHDKMGDGGGKNNSSDLLGRHKEILNKQNQSKPPGKPPVNNKEK